MASSPPIYGSGVKIYENGPVYQKQDEFLPYRQVGPDAPDYESSAAQQISSLLLNLGQATANLGQSFNMDSDSGGDRLLGVVIRCGVLADNRMYCVMQRLISHDPFVMSWTPPDPVEEDEHRRLALEHWEKKMWGTDFFKNNDMRRWIEKSEYFSMHSGKNWYNIMGFDQPSAQVPNPPRQLWVTLFKQIRDRFVHRGQYFLRTDINDMRTMMQQCQAFNSQEISDAEVIHRYFICVLQHLQNIPLFQ